MLRATFIALLALALAGCEDPSSTGFDPFTEEGIERLTTFQGVKPGEVSLADCTSSLCEEVRETETETFMEACTSDVPPEMAADVREFCDCAREDLFNHNSLQTLIAAYSSPNSFDIAMPNINQCTANAFFQ